MKKVRVDVPASTTNLGPGFDVLGVALKLYNTVEIEVTKSGLHLDIEGEGAEVLPRDDSNLVYRTIEALFDRVGKKPPPMKIRMINQIPLARGLGSSGAATVGALMAANAIADAGLSHHEILDMATSIDGHPDNVAASIFGGLVIASPTDLGMACMKLLPPKHLDVVVVVPDFHVLTNDARAVLPKSVDIETAVFNISRTSLLVAAFTTGDFQFLEMATDDKLHQPYREKLIPGMRDVFQAARSANGQVAVALSGSGPTIIAFCTNNCDKVGKNMQQAFLKHNIKSRVMVMDIDEEGVKVS